MTVIQCFTRRLLIAAFLVVVGNIQAQAWDTTPDANGKYDEYYDRPTHFPDWEQPSDWPNAEYYLVCARFGEDGPGVENYEVAVYDQNGKLRHCNRSMAKDNHLCVLTIRGTEGDQFHCQIIYGDDFDTPTIVDVPETFGFKTNNIVGSKDAPFYLTLPGRTFISETATELPAAKTGVDVTVIRTIKANEWGSICLPFAMTEVQVKTAFGDDVLLGDFTGCETTYEEDEETVTSIEVKFSEATAIEANHPYIIKVSADIAKFEVDGVDIQAEDELSVDCDRIGKGTKKDPYRWNSFVGNYVAGFTIPDQCLFLGGGKFWYSVGKTPLLGLRAYFDFYDVLPEAEAGEAGVRLTIAFDDGTTTAIEESEELRVKSEQWAGAWYDMSGRKWNPRENPRERYLVKGQLPKGVYINNGRKYIIK